MLFDHRCARRVPLWIEPTLVKALLQELAEG
jgi:hypothetical protein